MTVQMTPEQKMSTINKLMDEINAKRKKDNPTEDRPAIYIAGERPDLVDHGIIKTGNIAFDGLLHGGLRRGSLTILYGPESSGKTSLCLEAVANAQRQGLVCAYVHSEAAFPMEHARLLGVDLSKLIMIQDFTSGEAAFDILRKLLVTDKFVPRNILDLVVVDSIGGMASSAELKKMAEDGIAADTMGCHPKMMTKTMKLLFNTGAVGKAAVLMVNQVRDNLSYGGGTYMPGGRALRHASHVTVMVTKPGGEGMIIYENKKQVGHTVRLFTKKNKAGLGGHEGEEAFYVVRYNVGTDNVLPLFNAARLADLVVEPSKAYFQFNLPKEFLKPFGLWKEEYDKKGNLKTDEPVKIHGAEAAQKIIQTTPPLFNVLMSHIKDGVPLEEAIASQMPDREDAEVGTELDDTTAQLAQEVSDAARDFADNPEAALQQIEKELSVLPDED